VAGVTGKIAIELIFEHHHSKLLDHHSKIEQKKSHPFAIL
jgi:hypothetical protein